MRKHYDIMVDLESLSLRPSCAILQIGAVVFDPYGRGIIGKPFLVSVKQYSYLDDKYNKFHIDPETVDWWTTQSEAANASLELRLVDNLEEALEKFFFWITKTPFHRKNATDSCIWAQGSQFDIAALNLASAELGVTPPWQFYQERCCRTVIEDTYRELLPYEVVQYPDDLTAHRADHDAIRQVYNLQLALRAKNENNEYAPFSEEPQS